MVIFTKTDGVKNEKNGDTSESRKDRLRKLCSQWRDNVLEKSSLESFSTQSEEKELLDLAYLIVFLIRKVKSEKTADTDKIIFYLKSKCSAHNEESRIFIHDIPTEEPFFEAITGFLKTFLKLIMEDENMSLKNKSFFGGWILMESKVYRGENLSCRFEEWLYCLYKIKRQANYNYRILFKLMSAATKLMNCR